MNDEPIIEPKKIMPICSHCAADPLLPIARQINLPYKSGAPPAMFLIVYCQSCRKIIPISDLVFLGFPEPQNITNTSNGPLIVRPQ